MLIYNTIFVFLSFLALLDLSHKKNLLFFLFPCFILLLLTAIRGNGGDDFYVYEKYFNALPNEIFNYGYGYYSLNMFVKNFGEYPFFIIISSIICITLQAIFIYRETEKPTLVLFLFYSTSFLWLDFILIRQSISVGFFILAISFFKNNKKIFACLFLILSSLFHETTIFAGVVFYILYRAEKAGFLFTIGSVLIIAPFLSDIITIINDMTIKNNNITLYLEQRTLPSIANVIELTIAFVAFYIINKNSVFRESNEYKIYKSILYSSLCILLLSYTIPSLARFLEFFRFFYFILVVRMLMQFNVRSRYLFFVIILAYCFMRLNSFINQFDSGFDYIYNGKIL